MVAAAAVPERMVSKWDVDALQRQRARGFRNLVREFIYVSARTRTCSPLASAGGGQGRQEVGGRKIQVNVK